MLLNPYRFVSAVPHRYWAVLVHHNSGDGTNISIPEIQLRETAGGSDATGSGTASSTTNAGASYTADKAFDDNTATYFGSANFSITDQRIAYDFGASNEKNITEVVIQSSTFLPQLPSYCTVQYSDDGAAWSDSWGFVAHDWTTSQTKTFTKQTLSPTTPYRYWRLYIVVNNGNASNIAIAEIQLRATVSGSDATGSGTASASSTWSGLYPASNAFDNDNATMWISQSGRVSNSWIAYDFGSGNDLVINEVVLRVQGTNTTNMPKWVVVEASSDGTNWVPAWKFTATGWTSNEERAFARP